MIQQQEITVAPGVTGSTPDRYTVGLSKGILSTVVITPPAGPNWEVYTRILHLENAIIPDSNAQWIPLERNALTFNPFFDNWQGVYQVDIEICSPQARYPHTIQYTLEILERETSEQLLSDLIERGI